MLKNKKISLSSPLVCFHTRTNKRTKIRVVNEQRLPRRTVGIWAPAPQPVHAPDHLYEKTRNDTTSWCTTSNKSNIRFYITVHGRRPLALPPWQRVREGRAGPARLGGLSSFSLSVFLSWEASVFKAVSNQMSNVVFGNRDVMGTA